MRVYKLTDKNGKTRPGFGNETLWGEGVMHETSGRGGLCGPGWLHAYASVELAGFMNSIHASIKNPRLWEAEAEGIIQQEALKIGCTRLTTLRKITFTPPTREQCVRFAILCAKMVYSEPSWVLWANGWLDGTDRRSTYAVSSASVYSAAASYAADAHSAYYVAAAAEAAAIAAATAATNREVVAPIDFDLIAKSAMSGESWHYESTSGQPEMGQGCVETCGSDELGPCPGVPTCPGYKARNR